MNSKFQFYLGSLENGAKPELDDSAWETVQIPHTWNNIDGQDGTKNDRTINDVTDYFRGDGWYRQRLLLEGDGGEQFLLRLEGANMRADVYLNGQLAGSHKGGYTAFCVDLTPYAVLGQENLLAIRVNNEACDDIAPLAADFTFYGGIYRPMELITLGGVHFDRMDSGTRGLSVRTPAVSREKAECTLQAVLVNHTETEQTVTVHAGIGKNTPWEPNPFIKRTTWKMEDLEEDVSELTQSKEIRLAPGAKETVAFDFTVRQPHLWDGRRDPFRYRVHMSAVFEGETVDELADSIGLRYFHVDREKGFFLNGSSYPLRGVSRHQDRKGLGNALTNHEHDEDFSMIYEIGATAVRLAHYPQAEYFYRLCDAYGIVVWAEIPFVDKVGGDGSFDSPDEGRKGFFDVTKQQLQELIRQHGNHPSIVCWGLQNEVKAQFDDVMRPFMEELHTLARAEDPTRLTTQATNHPGINHWNSDLYAWNVYPGWYGMRRTQLGWFMDKQHKQQRPVGISEYGAGGNPAQHSATLKRPKHNGDWHPEEYQTACHEAFLKQINKRPYLWCTFVWNMFEFGSDWRNEGAVPGMNDKGLVSFDRTVKKDSFYVYQSNWYEFPMVQIAESRFVERKKKKQTLKVYSNCDTVELFLNGTSLGVQRQEKNKQRGIFLFKNGRLQKGKNHVRAVARGSGEELEQEAEFRLS